MARRLVRRPHQLKVPSLLKVQLIRSQHPSKNLENPSRRTSNKRTNSSPPSSPPKSNLILEPTKSRPLKSKLLTSRISLRRLKAPSRLLNLKLRKKLQPRRLLRPKRKLSRQPKRRLMPKKILTLPELLLRQRRLKQLKNQRTAKRSLIMNQLVLKH